ncbi:MAG: PotD/PotF family extracellular solute-binding protein [Phycisphaerales bacterium]
MLTRRDMMARSLGVGIATLGGIPYARARRRERVTLRVLGTHVTLQEQIHRAAEADLGIDIVFSPGGSGSVLQQASTRPTSFDVYEQWSNSMNVLWRSGAIQPIDTSRIRQWDAVNPLSKTGRLTPEAPIGRGDAPHTLLYIQPDGRLNQQPTNQVSFLPYVHNADSFGYNTDVIPRGEAYKDESWGWLMDPRSHGRVALVNEPTIGLFDAALAVQARGMMSFSDIGNMTRVEIDQLFDILIDHKRDGHFAGFWSSVPESVKMMQSGRANIESMFSPGAATLQADHVPVRYAAPKEGYRAWHGVMCLSSAASEEVTEAAYAYMNWWLSGKPGAIMARQGYYISVPEAAKQFMTQDEWAFWYEGAPAVANIPGVDGRAIARPGDTRNGGSYLKRFSHVAVWNTVMSEYEHTLLRWGELLSTLPNKNFKRPPPREESA